MTQTPAPACLTKKCRSSGGAPASGTPAHSTKLLLLLTEPDTIRLDCGLKLQQNT